MTTTATTENSLDLTALRNQVESRAGIQAATTQLRVHMGTCGIASGAQLILDRFQELLATSGAKDIRLVAAGCAGLCSREPLVTVQRPGQEPVLYADVTPKQVEQIFRDHVQNGQVVTDAVLQEADFFAKQHLVALANRGLIDPESLDDYIALDGYKALSKVLTAMVPIEIVAEIKLSGLRGRGGAGFPTGLKWDFCRKAPGTEKYVICNADEGDPGAFMDRSIIESDPHAVLEGMLIGARAIGASRGVVYIRDEYPLAVKRIHLAIDQARACGLLGDNILGTDFCFDLSVSRGAGAFVCGEETSLIASLEGSSPEPRSRPPFPAQSGFRGKPTNINNAETWANIARIILGGGAHYARLGTPTSKGTKVFSIVGKLRNSGLIEVPMGITLREIVFEIGGGIANGRKFKAVQTGGPSGGCLPESMLDTPIDYESLQKAGAIMGSGGMIVMDDTICMVEVARYFLNFTQSESCGKCPPCREGTRHMLKLLTDITQGNGKPGDIELLEQMATLVKDTALCGLGNTAPNPVLTTIRHFRHEYEAHIKDKRCPAAVCKALICYTIDPANCIGCGACRKRCPTQAISGAPKQPHTLAQDKCIKCGMCQDACKFDAVRCR